jgi:hypothetical protein
MSITLIITKYYDKKFNETGIEIEESEWNDFVESQDNLRLKTEPTIAKNPNTGEILKIEPLDGESEIFIENDWINFLYYGHGELRTHFSEELEDPSNPIRIIISQIAKHFNAIITHDAGDEILEW